jgi:hypothetical protein
MPGGDPRLEGEFELAQASSSSPPAQQLADGTPVLLYRGHPTFHAGNGTSMAAAMTLPSR